jgi:hypothetical protein
MREKRKRNIDVIGSDAITFRDGIEIVKNVSEYVIEHVIGHLIIERKLKQLNCVEKAEPTKHTLSNLIGICKLFVSADTYESFIGDLEERHAAISKTKGHRSARLWFWRQVVQSLFPLVFAAIRRVSGFEKLMGLYWRKRS